MRYTVVLEQGDDGGYVASVSALPGCVFRRQHSSHIILRRDNPYARVVVPDHKQVRAGTLRRIVADAGMTAEPFIQLL